MLALLFCVAIVSVVADLPLLETAYEEKGGSAVPPCSSVAFTFVVPPMNTTKFMFAVEMVPTTKATWTMQLTRDNPESSFGVSDTCALDTTTLLASGTGQSLVLVKSCGKMEGRWYVLVKSDASEIAKFSFKPVIYRGIIFSFQFSYFQTCLLFQSYLFLLIPKILSPQLERKILFRHSIKRFSVMTSFKSTSLLQRTFQRVLH